MVVWIADDFILLSTCLNCLVCGQTYTVEGIFLRKINQVCFSAQAVLK